MAYVNHFILASCRSCKGKARSGPYCGAHVAGRRVAASDVGIVAVVRRLREVPPLNARPAQAKAAQVRQHTALHQAAHCIDDATHARLRICSGGSREAHCNQKYSMKCRMCCS